jgi:integral membrane protein
MNGSQAPKLKTLLLPLWHMKLFQENEAWALFKFTAIGEGFGWALLLYGIFSPHYHLPGYTFMLPLGGSIHGMLFLAYLGVVLAGFTSLNWSWPKALLAVFLSVVPFATWVFESYCASKRRTLMLGSYRRIVVKPIISHNGKILAAQLSTGIDWVIPGDFASAGETLSRAAERIIFNMTGVHPMLESLPKVDITDPRTVTFYFFVTNGNKYNLETITSKMKQNLAIDDLGYKDQADIPELSLFNFSSKSGSSPKELTA